MTHKQEAIVLSRVMEGETGDAVRQYLDGKKIREDDDLLTHPELALYHVGRLAMLKEIRDDLDRMKNVVGAMDRIEKEGKPE